MTTGKHPTFEGNHSFWSPLDALVASFGDYFAIEENDDLLGQPHPFDPNRLAAMPLGGYGWPSDEMLCLLLPVLRGEPCRTIGFTHA